MLYHFAIGFLIGIILCTTQYLINWIIKKKFKAISDNEVLALGTKKTWFYETLFISAIYAVLYVLCVQFNANFILILMLSFFVSYSAILKPYIYSIKSKKRDRKLEEVAFTEGGVKVTVIVSDADFVNAYAYGAIPFANVIVLSSQIVERLSAENLKAILFHEVAHLKKKHLLFIYLYNLVMVFLYYNLLKLMLSQLDQFLPFQTLLIIVFGGTLLGLIWYFLPVPFMLLFERQADLYAAKIVGKNQYCDMLHELDIVTKNGLTNNDFYHPTLKKRVNYVLQQT